MRDIKIKRSYLKIDQLAYVSSFICFTIGCLQIALACSWPLELLEYIILLFTAITLIGCSAYSLINALRNSPSVLFNEDILMVREDIYYWKDFASVSFNGQKPCKCIFRYSMEGMTIQFADNKKVILFDYAYSNLWILKLFIKQVIVEKNKEMKLPQPHINQEELENEHFVAYKGNAIFSTKGIFYWCIIAVLTFLYVQFYQTLHLSNYITEGMAILIGMTLFVLILITALTITMNYFLLSDRYLLIRNHILFWRKEIYAIKDICEATIENGFKKNKKFSLRLISNNFKYRFYPAWTLSQKTWQSFSNDLRRRDIKVRNE